MMMIIYIVIKKVIIIVYHHQMNMKKIHLKHHLKYYIFNKQKSPYFPAVNGATPSQKPVPNTYKRNKTKKSASQPTLIDYGVQTM